MFPRVRCYAAGPANQFPNAVAAEGWFDYNADIDAENLGTDEAQLAELVDRDGVRLLTLNQYIVASQDSLCLTGRYLDDTRTWTRVATTIDGKMVAARFDGPDMAVGLGDEEPFEGALLVGYDIVPADRGPTLGARTTAAVSDAVRDAETQVVWDRIATRFVAAGFPDALAMSRERYLQSLPRPFPQPPAYRGRLDQALLVETRLPWTTQVELLGMAMSFDGRDNPYWPVGERSAAPAKAYVGWFGRWGVRFPDPIAPDDARAQLRTDEVGANPYDLIAMAIAEPQLLVDGRFFDAIGYLARPLAVAGYDLDETLVRTPGMYHWRGKAEIGANMHPVAFATFRPLVRGDRIELGPRGCSVAARQPGPLESDRRKA
jgi:hypothetical protein